MAGATAVLGGTRVEPVPGGVARTEAWLEQPVLMARAALWRKRVRFYGTLDLEGAVMPNGVPTLGGYGEGFVDRRHPHTYVHELIGALVVPVGRTGVTASLAAGKGFVAFGTDDPMNRPPLRFPANHHHSQILERAVVVVGLRAGPATIEGTLFNGDEPERPAQWPRLARFADSWASRLTVSVARGVALQVSVARVASPEHRPGAGLDQAKWSAAARVARGDAYAHAEWARTSEAAGFFVFRSLLAEGAYRRGRFRPYYRFERTDRPEEERLLDPFRSRRPALDDAILGVTRWTIHTVGLGVRIPAGRLTLQPLVELAYARVRALGQGLFQPEAFYGRDHAWSLTAGLRLRVGATHRMGRYGVLDRQDD